MEGNVQQRCRVFDRVLYAERERARAREERHGSESCFEDEVSVDEIGDCPDQSRDRRLVLRFVLEGLPEVNEDFLRSRRLVRSRLEERDEVFLRDETRLFCTGRRGFRFPSVLASFRTIVGIDSPVVAFALRGGRKGRWTWGRVSTR